MLPENLAFFKFAPLNFVYFKFAPSKITSSASLFENTADTKVASIKLALLSEEPLSLASVRFAPSKLVFVG